MNQHARHLFKMISVLLQYPCDDLLNTVAAVRERLYELPPGPGSDRCHEFLQYLERTPLLRLREIYAETFDLGVAPLHLTFHTHGETGERGKALCRWRLICDEAGYEPVDGELPDYLPMVLELMSICPGEMDAVISDACREPVRRLSEKLRTVASPYAGILEGLSALLADVRPGSSGSEA